MSVARSKVHRVLPSLEGCSAQGPQECQRPSLGNTSSMSISTEHWDDHRPKGAPLAGYNVDEAKVQVTRHI